MPGYSPVRLEVRGPGDAVLIQDGVDLMKTIGGVASVTLHANGKAPPTVTLELFKPFTYEGPAEINALRADPPVVTIVEFLNAVQPADLEAAALEAGGGLGGPGVGESFLMALKAMAKDFDGA